MKLILSGMEGQAVRIATPSLVIMSALTNGGLGQLPGDAVTADLAEDESRRLEVSESMPRQRAIDNMVRAGHDHDFAVAWTDAVLAGGETDATALEMIGTKSFVEEEGLAPIESDRRPARWFREAWRRSGDGIVIDLPAAKRVFAERLVSRKAETSNEARVKADIATILGDASIEATYFAMVAIDLKAIGAKVMKATSPEDLLALWPDGLGAF
jgi:hypothetical protein